MAETQSWQFEFLLNCLMGVHRHPGSFYPTYFSGWSNGLKKSQRTRKKIVNWGNVLNALSNSISTTTLKAKHLPKLWAGEDAEKQRQWFVFPGSHRSHLVLLILCDEAPGFCFSVVFLFLNFYILENGAWFPLPVTLVGVLATLSFSKCF